MPPAFYNKKAELCNCQCQLFLLDKKATLEGGVRSHTQEEESNPDQKSSKGMCPGSMCSGGFQNCYKTSKFYVIPDFFLPFELTFLLWLSWPHLTRGLRNLSF